MNNENLVIRAEPIGQTSAISQHLTIDENINVFSEMPLVVEQVTAESGVILEHMVQNGFNRIAGCFYQRTG